MAAIQKWVSSVHCTSKKILHVVPQYSQQPAKTAVSPCFSPLGTFIPRETSSAAKSEEKRLFSQAIYIPTTKRQYLALVRKSRTFSYLITSVTSITKPDNIVEFLSSFWASDHFLCESWNFQWCRFHTIILTKRFIEKRIMTS